MIIIPKRSVDITPSGERGFAFEKGGYQERNIGNLLEVLGSKEAQKTLQELAETSDKKWSDMRTAASDFRQATEAGGVGQIYEDLKTSFVNSLTEPLEAAVVAPIKNELSAAISEIMNPIIQELHLDELAGEVGKFTRWFITGEWGKDVSKWIESSHDRLMEDFYRRQMEKGLWTPGGNAGEFHAPGGDIMDFSNITVDANGNIIISPPTSTGYTPRPNTVTYNGETVDLTDLSGLLDYGGY